MDEPNDTSDVDFILPLGKILLGAVGAAAIAYTLPIYELLGLFVSLVVIPGVFLWALGYVLEGFIQLLGGLRASDIPQHLRERVDHWRQEFDISGGPVQFTPM